MTRRRSTPPRRPLPLLGALCLASCGRGPAERPTAAAPDPAPIVGIDAVELLPGVRVDLERRVVEFEGFVPVDAFDPDAPDVWLEQIVCTPDTREHESLVVTEARPSHIHAALIAIGLQSGSPGSWRTENQESGAWRVVLDPPTGDRVIVEFITRDDAGNPRLDRAESWVVSARTGLPLGAERPIEFVFAGSRLVTWQGREVYDADFAGTLIGLATFGGETIALSRVIPHAEAVEPLQWKANIAAIPPFGTPVTVRLRPAEPARSQPNSRD
ncbi:MAG: YdjY domain-containing protein [Phycisphaerales bacterium JB037]